MAATKAWVQVQEGAQYSQLAPHTYVNAVLMDTSQTSATLDTKIKDLEERITALETILAGGQKEHEHAKIVVSSSTPPVEENTIWIKP